MKYRLSLEVHRHGRAGQPDDIAPQVTGLTWSRSISGPWQSLSVHWKAPLKDSFTRVVPGDWLVLKILSPSATMNAMLARVQTVDCGAVSQGPALQTTSTHITAVGWWDFLLNTKLYTPLGDIERVGTMMSYQAWGEVVLSLEDDFISSRLGRALKRTFAHIAKVSLPETLGGGKDITLGDAIPVVHDDTTQKEYAPARVVESPDVGIAPGVFTQRNLSTEATVGELLVSTWQPEPLLFELFPSFESATTRKPTLSDGSERLASVLGGWEVLLYRIKPFRMRPLREAAVAWITYKHDEVEAKLEASIQALASSRVGGGMVAGATLAAAALTQRATARSVAANQIGINTLTSRYFNRVTWDYNRAIHIPARMTRSFSCTRSDGERINISSLLFTQAAVSIEAIPSAGLPIYYEEEIRRHGARPRRPQWPFFLPDKAISDELANEGDTPSSTNTPEARLGPEALPTVEAYVRTICAQLLQFYKNGHLYGHGAVGLTLSAAMLLTEGEDRLLAEQVLNLQPGEIIALQFDEPFHAYVEKVTHDYKVVDGGLESGTTTVEFSHGHFRVSEDLLAKAVEVPINAGVQLDQGPGAAPGLRARNIRTFQQQCSVGEQINFWPHTWGDTRDNVFNSTPNWLRVWAIANGWDARAFMLDRYPQELLFPQQTDILNSYWIPVRAVTSAAIAWVLQRYWRLYWPEARVIFKGNPPTLRTNTATDKRQNHVSGSAFDFVVLLERGRIAPVLQTWASLYRLMDARRIPMGAAGLYLNCGPEGLTGTRWDEAGNPVTRGYAPGSSSGVHFDVRGSLYRVEDPRSFQGYKHYDPRAPRNMAPTSYVWVNTTGRGPSDKQDADALAWLQANQPDVADYFTRRGRYDPELWSADDPYVPNIKQVLFTHCFRNPPEW